MINFYTFLASWQCVELKIIHYTVKDLNGAKSEKKKIHVFCIKHIRTYKPWFHEWQKCNPIQMDSLARLWRKSYQRCISIHKQQHVSFLSYNVLIYTQCTFENARVFDLLGGIKIGNHQKSIRVRYIKKISSICKLGFKCMQQWLWVFALLNDNIVFWLTYM